MLRNPYAAYLESAILTAEPLELINRLYAAALDAVAEAQAHLEAGRILERGQAISKASSILLHLSAVIDPAHDPALAHNLIELYDYMQRQLTQAHVQPSAKALVEVANLLTTLSEAWRRVEPAVSPAAFSSSLGR
ncbi:MAG TPA: flagellar export chaperone FliS [Bryobacteraceae bacterium]|nr:flagellar export chaperone FliS [Bryobacteraceae bacterium]